MAGTGTSPRKRRLAGGATAVLPFAQQQAPAVETEQQVPVALAYGPVFVVGHSQRPVGKDTSTCRTPPTVSVVTPMALSFVPPVDGGYGSLRAPSATVVLQTMAPVVAEKTQFG